MSIRYDYGKTSKRYGFLDYKKAIDGPEVPGMPAPESSTMQGGPTIDTLGLMGQPVAEQMDPVSAYSQDITGPAPTPGEDTLSNDYIASGRNAYSDIPEGGIQSPKMRTRSYSGPGGLQAASPRQSNGGMKRPELRGREKREGTSNTANRAEAKGRSQRFIKKDK